MGRYHTTVEDTLFVKTETSAFFTVLHFRVYQLAIARSSYSSDKEMSEVQRSGDMHAIVYVALYLYPSSS